MKSDLQGRRIVLVGGAGFIGHHLALYLAKEGAHVEIIDGLQVNNLLAFATDNTDMANRNLYLRIINQRLDLLRASGIPLHVQDARDFHALSKILTHIKPQVIIHLAAVAHAGRSNKDPFSTFDHSLRTLENALDDARGNIEHFVFLSSSMVYGDFMQTEVDESHPLNPVGIYGALKVGGEKLVIAYQQVFDLPYTIIRPSALYGPRCVSRRVVQIFIENAMQGLPLQVEQDGTDRLDFTHIDDLVYGIGLVITNPGARNQIFNMTYGQSRSIQELVAIIQSQFPSVEIQSVARDKMMPARGTLNIAKARHLLGYEPKLSIESGFPAYVEWYKQLFLTRDAPGPSTK